MSARLNHSDIWIFKHNCYTCFSYITPLIYTRKLTHTQSQPPYKHLDHHFFFKISYDLFRCIRLYHTHTFQLLTIRLQYSTLVRYRKRIAFRCCDELKNEIDKQKAKMSERNVWVTENNVNGRRASKSSTANGYKSVFSWPVYEAAALNITVRFRYLFVQRTRNSFYKNDDGFCFVYTIEFMCVCVAYDSTWLFAMMAKTKLTFSPTLNASRSQADVLSVFVKYVFTAQIFNVHWMKANALYRAVPSRSIHSLFVYS